MPKKSKRFEEKTRKLHRLLAILRKLDSRERFTPQTLAEKFETTPRTIFRDIDDLNTSGFSITFNKEFNTYCFADPDFTLRDLNLDNNELKALFIGSQVTRWLGKPFEKAFQSILKKAYKDTGQQTRKKAERLVDKQRFWIDMEPADEFEKIEKQYNALNEAMDKKVEIEIDYKSIETEEESRRAIAPYGLFLWSGLWYAIAFCNLRKDVRVFALDCIKDFKLTNTHYNIPPDFSLEEYFKPGWHMLRYGEPVEIVLEFGKEYARWIKRRKWHHTQKIEEKPNGSIIFKVTLEGTREIKRWIYHWIPYCKVIAPAELRNEMMQEMKAMVGVYEKER
ncbi:MAG: transcriptional regulator [Nitrospirae bacterium]|nr:transcriptional regulator [Nitrospirota bacterium]